jgi:hypothetical protein
MPMYHKHPLELHQYPIINSTHHLLPSPHGELAPAIEAWLDVFGAEILVVVAHNGQGQIVIICGCDLVGLNVFW